MTWLFKDPIYIFDLETNSPLPDRANILEIGAVKITADSLGCDEHDHFSTRVYPGENIRIPASTVAIHGITEEDVKDAPPLKEALGMLFDWASPGIFGAHNLYFDYTIMDNEMDRVDFDPPYLPKYFFCTLLLARRLICPTEIANYKLGTLVKYFKVEQRKAHEALGDVLMTADVFVELLKLLPLETERDFERWIQNPYKLDRVPFGQHSGKRFEDLSSFELQKDFKKVRQADDVKFTVNEILIERS